jgi:hypothetical protein
MALTLVTCQIAPTGRLRAYKFTVAWDINEILHSGTFCTVSVHLSFSYDGTNDGATLRLGLDARLCNVRTKEDCIAPAPFKMSTSSCNTV